LRRLGIRDSVLNERVLKPGHGRGEIGSDGGVRAVYVTLGGVQMAMTKQFRQAVHWQAGLNQASGESMSQLVAAALDTGG
jgi:hypothetical protein